ncbi:hypothetical protein [Timonella senegalensis]|uniref:hypothetical protein n=3 Tax=Timonella senegalensis TaxID=1465825 RepID=UPI002FDED7EA
MKYRAIPAITALILLPSGAAYAEVPSDPPAVIEEAFSPGSDLYNEAIELLEYQGSITQTEARTATTAKGRSVQNPSVTYGAPARTAYLELEENATGPIGESGFTAMANRYIAVQYVNGEAVGSYTVDTDGEFIEMGQLDEDIIVALENWDEGAIYATNGVFGLRTKISADGESVTALNESALSAFGTKVIDADKFRELIANLQQKNREASDPEFSLEDPVEGRSSVADSATSTFMPTILAASGAAITLSAAFLLGRGRRSHSPIVEDLQL